MLSDFRAFMALMVEINKPCLCLSIYIFYCSIWFSFLGLTKLRQYLYSFYSRHPVLTIIFGYNNLADQITIYCYLGSTIFGNANNVVGKSKFFFISWKFITTNQFMYSRPVHFLGGAVPLWECCILIGSCNILGLIVLVHLCFYLSLVSNNV